MPGGAGGVDTSVKRSSVVDMSMGIMRCYPNPTGLITALQRQGIVFLYVGIRAGAPPTFAAQWAGNANVEILPTPSPILR